jgi:hypothetical protein
MSDLTFYAGGDSITFESTLTNLDGATVDADSITLEVRRSKSDKYNDWTGGAVVQSPATMTNFALGVYRYNWSTAAMTAGVYHAECCVVRGAVTNRYRLKVTLV